MHIFAVQVKKEDFIYYIVNLTITFCFIGLSETWASECNQDILGITDYSHKQCICSNNKKEGGTSLYIHSSIQYRRRGDLALPKNYMNQYLLK